MKALLTVGLSSEAVESLRRMTAASAWQIHSVSGWMQVFLRLRERCYKAVLCEASLPDGDWRDALDELRVCTDPPPFIVVSRFADARLWVSVLDAGGYDLLPYPFESAEMLRVVEQARSSATSASRFAGKWPTSPQAAGPKPDAPGRRPGPHGSPTEAARCEQGR